MDDHELADLVDDLREQLQEARDAGRAQQSVISAHEEARRQAETALSIDREKMARLLLILQECRTLILSLDTEGEGYVDEDKLLEVLDQVLGA